MNVEEPSNQSHAYLEAFLTERPRDGVEFVQNRLRKALKLNEELAEYFKERAHAEDLYAKSLAKLSKKYFVTDKSALGLMVPIWEMLQNELTELYTIHSVFALKITEDIERPLRSSIQNDRDYESIKTLDIGMQRLVKDFDERLTRVQKHKKNMGKKSEAATKLADATKSLEDVRAQWQRSGTDYIEKHQAVDEHRLEALKNTIQSFEVLQTDQLLKRIEVSNNVLSAVSGFDIQEEINAFCASKPKNIHSLKPASAAANAAEEPLAPVPAIQTTDTSIEIPQSERSITSFESSATQEPVPTPSVSDSNRPRAGSTKKAGRERKFLSTLVSIRRKPKATENNGYLNADLASPAMNHDDGSIASAGINNGSFISNGNSIHEHDDKHDHSNIQSDDAASSAAPTSPTSFRSTTIEMSPSQAGSTLGHDQQQRHHEPMVDAEGYTIPPPDRAVWPGDAAVASLIDDDFSSDNASTFSNQQRLQVNIRNESVAEEDKTAAVALNRVSSILKEKSPLASGRRRGRREMRSTRLLNPVQEVQQQQHQEHQQPPVITSEPVTPIPSNAEPVSPFEDVAEPTTTTVTPAAAAPPKIKVQITETIHAQLKGGQVARSAIWGEVKITYYGPAETSAPVCFEFNSNKSSARVVPNENYIKAVEGHPGIYQLQTSMYNLAGESAVPSIKYQIDTDPHDAVIPLLVKPMWKCDQDQTRLLVKYRKNPNSVLPDVHGVFFMTTVSGNVQGVQSIPAGQWMVDQQRMVWPVDEWQDTKEQTLRAKFVTTEQGSPQPLAVRFEVKDALASTVSVTRPENGDEEYLWADVQVVEQMVRSGKYVAEV